MAEEAILSATLRHRLGSLHLDVDFHLHASWTILFGPSGAGKSTVLRAIAGFVRPEVGLITAGLNSRVLLSTRDRVFVPPHLRPVRTAAQRARLFPGMRVRANVAYGMGWSSAPREHAAGIAEVLTEILALFRLSSLGERRPENLSGGEQQRVSMARAVASAVTFDGPGRALLLLDEPFSGLDAALKDDLAIDLRRFLERWKIPVLSVSHDVAESFLLEAEVIRIAEGQVVDQGPAERVLREERERLLAGLQR